MTVASAASQETSPSSSTSSRRLEDESWRKPGKQFRANLLGLDAKNSFQLKAECEIERYFQVVDRVMNQFLQHPIDSRNEIIEAYLIGSRLIHFLSAILPTHPNYFSHQPALAVLRDKAQAQLVELSGYVEVIAKMLDRQEHERYISYVLDDRTAPRDSSSLKGSRSDADARRYRDGDDRTNDDATLDDFRSVQNQELEELSQSIDSSRQLMPGHDDWDSDWVKQHSRMHAVLDQEASVVTEEESVSLSREHPYSPNSKDPSHMESTEESVLADAEYLPFRESPPSQRKDHRTGDSTPPNLSPGEKRRSAERASAHDSEREAAQKTKPTIAYGSPPGSSGYPKPDQRHRLERRQDSFGPHAVSSSRTDGSGSDKEGELLYEEPVEPNHQRGKTVHTEASVANPFSVRRLPIDKRNYSGNPGSFKLRQGQRAESERPPPHPESAMLKRLPPPTKRIVSDHDVLEDPDPEPQYYEEDESQSSQSIDDHYCKSAMVEDCITSRRPSAFDGNPAHTNWDASKKSQDSNGPPRDSGRKEVTSKLRSPSMANGGMVQFPTTRSECTSPERMSSWSFPQGLQEQRCSRDTGANDGFGVRASESFGASPPDDESFVAFPGSDFFKGGEVDDSRFAGASGFPGGSLSEKRNLRPVNRNSTSQPSDIRDGKSSETLDYREAEAKSIVLSASHKEYCSEKSKVQSEQTEYERAGMSEILGYRESEPRFMVNITVDDYEIVNGHPEAAEKTRQAQRRDIPLHRQATARASVERLEALRARRLAYHSRDDRHSQLSASETKPEVPEYITPNCDPTLNTANPEEVSEDGRSGSNAGVHKSDSRTKDSGEGKIQNPPTSQGGIGPDMNTSFQSIENDSVLNGEVEQIIFHESMKRSKYESFQTRATKADMAGVDKAPSPNSRGTSSYDEGYETADEEDSMQRRTFDPFSDTEESEQLDIVESRRRRDVLIEAMRLEQVTFLQSSPPRSPDQHALRPSRRDVPEKRQHSTVSIPLLKASVERRLGGSQPVDLDETVEDDQTSEEGVEEVTHEYSLSQETFRIRSLLFADETARPSHSSRTRIEQRLEEASTKSLSRTSPSSVTQPPTKGSNLRKPSDRSQGFFGDDDDDTEMVNAFVLQKRRPFAQFRGCVRCLME